MPADQKHQKWYLVTVVCESGAEDAVDTAFGILDSDGTEIDTLGKTGTGTLEVKGYFVSPPSTEDISRALDGAFEAHDCPRDKVISVTTDEVVNTDWLLEWKKHWKATTVKRFVIAPPWEEIEDSGKIIIRIEPQMAFGTGTHETTRLCLEFIDKLFEKEMSFLDVGTGTGILSIAAAKMADVDSLPEFEAVDTDVDSVLIARENARLNGVDGIKFSVGSITDDTGVFEFVCANMTIDIIRPILELLIAKTSNTLILSGILVEQESEILERLRKLNAPEPNILRDGEWIALALKF